MRQVGGFLRVLPVSSTNKTDCHDIAEILLKVALNTNSSNRTTRGFVNDSREMFNINNKQNDG